MPPFIYIVLCEFEKQEYVIGIYKSKRKAIKKSEEIDAFGSLISSAKELGLLKYLEENALVNYRLNGNGTWIGNSILLSPGEINVSVSELSEEEFSLPLFIKERQNHSLVFEYEDINSNTLPTFPYIHYIAN